MMSTFEGGFYRIKTRTMDGDELCFLHSGPIEEHKSGYIEVEREKLYVYAVSYTHLLLRDGGRAVPEVV